ncbi:MAG: ESPR-type extended signal peptide-containing protein [Dialister sp.]|uniref:ESPR-type extended signal peptide-containing protein n=1 Tax=Dialister sp. TaxID=1955814 RepID=UPI002E7A69F8|nr:ESPR-type extended signal peptide-containing protein [Dialister sp.]MEE0292317.1 ESPR-type extended signal peptide-containing protein [Dialister sp.]
MNKIYKVIWSKAKHTYVVASEIAKGHTKGETTGRGLKKLAAALLVAAALMGPNFAWAADTTKVEPAPDGSATAVEVYTKEEANNAFATIENVSTLGHTVNTLSSELDTLSTLVNTLQSSTAKVDADGKVAKAVAADSAESATKAEQDGAGNVIISTYATKTEVSQKADASTVTDEASAREAGDKTLNDRITAVKEHVLKETGDNYVSKADAAVQDAGVVKADKKIGENVTALGKGLYDETAARIGADAAQDKVIKQVNDNLVASVNTINKNVADGFTALNQAGANEAAAREAKDNELNERITNEANAIHDEIKAGDKVLDDRITNVKEYLEKQTSDNYVSKADAAVQDGAVVKAANTIGENVTNLDAALAKETAARLGADKAQDKVIEQVNQNMVDGFNTINKNMSDGFTALSQADANELAGRMAADTKLVEATNGGLSLDNDNVLQKTKTKISSTGEVTTSKEAATTLILNKGAANQVKIDSEGVTVGTSSTQMDAEGFTAGGHDYDAAGAALMSDGRIKGANGAFTVDENGNVASKATITGETVTDGKGASMSNGTVTGKTLTDGKAAISNGNIKTNGGFIRTGGGNINTQGGALRTKGGNINAGSGTITGNKLTDGVASLQNGNLSTTGNINVHDIVATGNIKGNAITGTSLNTQGGDINGGAITGTTINGTTGTFGSLSTTGNASVGGTLTTNGITNTGNATTDTLTVNHNATVGGNLGVTGDITGKSLNVGTGDIKGGQITGTGLDVGAGTIKTTGAVETGTLTTTGNATIGGDLDVKGDLSVEGEFNAKTLSSKLDENNYTTINGGKTQSMNLKLDAATGETKSSASTFDENGSNAWAKDDDSIGKSTVTADGISQKLSDTGDNPTVYAERTMSQGTDKKYSMVDTVKDGDKTNVASQTASESSSVVSGKDGENNYKSYITQNLKKILQKIEDGDGNVLTSTEQTETDITNTAEKGTIANNAQNIINHASENMTNTVGKNLETTVGGNKNETVTGTSTETVTGKKTENYNGGLETTVTGDEKHAITGSQTNTIGGSQTTTVTGDSSLKAENITNEAKNKITNKALDVETDAASSIVSKVSNEYGSNTSTQLSYETKEEMSQADGKIASYLRGAAEEKSQLTDGDKKTTVDTIAGQTNTNITDGTNTSNDLQKADQIASSVTDGTNTTVVNQNAKSLASSITDGAKANNTNNTVDKSEQLIKADDTRYYAETKTAGSAVEALKSDGNTIISAKDAVTGTVSSVVTDGTNTTGSTMTAKGITNSAAESIVNEIGDGSAVKSEMTADGITNTAKGGTIYNKSKNILNEASGDILNFADGEIGNSATKITNLTGDNTVTSDTNGTTFENKAHSTAVKEGTITKTTISGNTLETGKATMDYAEVMKDLGVRGNAAVDGNTILGKEGAETTLTVNSKSTFKDTVKMEKTLEVDGTSTFNDKVTVTKGGLDVTGGTTTDTLHVTSTSTFDGKATFKDIVTMEKDLSVGGNATVAGDVTANSYKVGDKTYIDKDGINANNQVIRNVGQGNITEGSTDAVSGGQLYETNTRVSGLETRMGTVETKVDKLDGKIDKVGANAAAMANLHPLEFDEDSKWNIAAAVGSSGSETASAVGVFYRPNENVMVNASAAMGTGENMFGGGVSLRLGHGGNKAKEAQMKAAAAENKELRAKVDDLTARMDALLSVLNPNMSKDFPDVPENHWAYEAVSRLAGNGIVEGYEDGKYHGERQMTRYEMAEIIYNALSKGAKAEKKLVEEFRPELQAMAAQKKA